LFISSISWRWEGCVIARETADSASLAAAATPVARLSGFVVAVVVVGMYDMASLRVPSFHSLHEDLNFWRVSSCRCFESLISFSRD